MLEEIRDKSTLQVAKQRMGYIRTKLLKGERLTEWDEKYLKLNLLGTDPRREFRDKKHRDRLLAQWWGGMKVLDKKFKEEER